MTRITVRATLVGVLALLWLRPAHATAQSDIVVELAREGTVVRRVSDSQGRFDFSDLAPGRWTLTVVDGMPPAHHSLERETVPLQLRAGRAEEVVNKVVPNVRAIRMLRAGEIEVERKK